MPRFESKHSFKFNFVSSICLHIDRHMCGQTSRPVVGAEIQTRCSFDASPCSYNLFLVNRTLFGIFTSHCLYSLFLT